MKKVFVSYSHCQGEWVRDRLVPVLRAAGCAEVLIDTERFIAGHAVIGQMDSEQDRADVSVLVLSPEYQASSYCRHERDRAIAADPQFELGRVIPVVRADCDLVFLTGRPDPPMWVDLRDDRDDDRWKLLLRSLGADRLGVSASHWLEARDDLIRKLQRDRISVNLLVRGEVNWRCLVEHLRDAHLADLAVVDLDRPATIARNGLVSEILRSFGIVASVPRPPGDLVALDTHLSGRDTPALLLLQHFDNLAHRRGKDTIELFHTFRSLLQRRKLLLLVQSRQAFHTLIPGDHPLSGLQLDTVVLGEAPS